MTQRLRILLADDHPVFRDGLRAVLSSFGDVDVVAEAQTGAEAVALAIEHEPHVVLMDLHMPDTNGIEATRRIVAERPEVGVLVLTMAEDDDAVFAAMRAGARGYLVKGSNQAEILHAVRAVGAGEAVFGRAIADRLREYFSPPAGGRSTAFPDLTRREHEVLELLARGETNAAIAGRLSMSEKTVRNHVSSIFNKLHVADRAHAIVKAREAGLGLDPA